MLRKEKSEKKIAFLNFNFVDLCHDAAIQTSLMALAAPSVVATHQRKNAFFFEFAAQKFGR